MALVKRSIFQGKEYLDLVESGKTMVVDKLVYITKHKTLIADNSTDNSKAGTVTVTAISHHAETLVVLVDHQHFNLPLEAGDYCSTVIDAAGWSDNYEAVYIDVDWGNAVDTAIYLQDVGTEAIKFRSTKPLMTESDNTGA